MSGDPTARFAAFAASPQMQVAPSHLVDANLLPVAGGVPIVTAEGEIIGAIGGRGGRHHCRPHRESGSRCGREDRRVGLSPGGAATSNLAAVPWLLVRVGSQKLVGALGCTPRDRTLAWLHSREAGALDRPRRRADVVGQVFLSPAGVVMSGVGG
ncbi:heme-binding protein [Streptomyces sp. ME18-1-4]|uniref:heme-binding protein n=1 Tax=Streptomyces sp. ME18-1-4 TaxID=3028685 RepID=UPI0029BB9CFE|nr:hypothetical protein [Streptomyces sp. ME18-1-4]MDX3244325.1 hypothetical protein [Streptomyces sp. ME18-1-4]